jgi:hypothetical protein
MKQQLKQSLVIFGLLAASSFTALAQAKPSLPNDDTFKVLTDKPPAKPLVRKTVKGAPYSATATTETVQTLNDGNQIIRRNETKLYRDGQGRTRMEQTLETMGRWVASGEAPQIITITDPVARTSFSLDPLTRTAHKNTYALKKDGRVVTRAESEALREKPAAGEAAPQIIPSKESKPWEMQAGISGDPRKKIESLGKQVIEGLETVGTRATYTIPAGEIGNTLPIEIVEETWYSPALDLMVLTKTRDPRSGETTYRLTNLNRNEPDGSLFEVPADYTVAKARKPTPEEE